MINLSEPSETGEREYWEVLMPLMRGGPMVRVVDRFDTQDEALEQVEVLRKTFVNLPGFACEVRRVHVSTYVGGGLRYGELYTNANPLQWKIEPAGPETAAASSIPGSTPTQVDTNAMGFGE